MKLTILYLNTLIFPSIRQLANFQKIGKDITDYQNLKSEKSSKESNDQWSFVTTVK